MVHTKCIIAFKGTVSLFCPRGPEIALTFLRNEFIVKLRKWGRVMAEMVKISSYFLNDPISSSNDPVSSSNDPVSSSNDPVSF